jgi:hypothetical protein
MTKKSKFQTCFDHLILALWNFAFGEPAEGRAWILCWFQARSRGR